MKKLYYMAIAVFTAFALSACGGGNGSPAQENGGKAESAQTVRIDLGEVGQAVKSAYGENYIPSFAYDEQAMADLFGISKEMYEEFLAEGPMISVNVDTFVAVKAIAGKGGDVENALKDYRKRLVGDTMQYPMNQSKVEASEVVRHGDYVFFVMLGTASDEALDAGEEAALEASKKENQKAIDAINEFFQ